MFHILTFYKFGLYDFKCGFRCRIVIGTAFLAQWAVYVECLKRFIQCSVFKLVSSICVKYLYFLRIYIYSAKRLDYQCSIFVLSCAVTYDFLIKQVD